MRNLLDDFSTARGLDTGWYLPRPDEKQNWKKLDAFVLEAMIMKAEANRSLDTVSHEDIAESRSHYGLSRYQALSSVWKWIATEGLPSWEDAPLWLWGPSTNRGRLLYEAAARMGRGEIVRALKAHNWDETALRALFREWLHAARVHVHAKAEVPALDVFMRPPAPLSRGRTEQRPPTPEMVRLARQLCHEKNFDTPAMVTDTATALAWIAAKAQGADRVRLPSKALTQGRREHPDSPGIVMQRGRRIWSLLLERVLEKSRGHSAGNFNAEYSIRPECRAILAA